MVVKNKNSKVYAMCVIPKHAVIDAQCAETTILERQIMTNKENNPFIMRAVHTWQDENRLFMVSPLARGGELFRLLVKNRRLKENVVKFFTV